MGNRLRLERYCSKLKAPKRQRRERLSRTSTMWATKSGISQRRSQTKTRATLAISTLSPHCYETTFLLQKPSIHAKRKKQNSPNKHTQNNTNEFGHNASKSSNYIKGGYSLFQALELWV